MDQLVAAMQAQLDGVPCQAVKEVKNLIFALNMNGGQKLDIELSGVLPDAAKAEQVKTALEAGKKKLVILMGFARAGMPAPMYKALDASLKALTITQTDTSIQVKLSIDAQGLQGK